MSADAKLCPREPTEAMLEQASDYQHHDWHADIWRAMYDAAPAPATEKPTPERITRGISEAFGGGPLPQLDQWARYLWKDGYMQAQHDHIPAAAPSAEPESLRPTTGPYKGQRHRIAVQKINAASTPAILGSELPQEAAAGSDAAPSAGAGDELAQRDDEGVISHVNRLLDIIHHERGEHRVVCQSLRDSDAELARLRDRVRKLEGK